MGLFNSLLDRLAAALGKRIQGYSVQAAFTDANMKGRSYSVEDMISESLATLACSGFSMPISGSERAKQLDQISDGFVDGRLTGVIALGLLTGDAIVVPSWNGHSMESVVVDAGNYAILGANGDELTSVIYVVDQKRMRNGTTYTLMRLVELVPYTANDGTQAYANRYKTYIMADGGISSKTLADFPDWAERNEDEWVIPNVETLLVGRFRCPAYDPMDPNAQKGVPVCFGASDPIKEIHYLTEQMHNEFQLSEKAVFANRDMFAKRYVRDSDGNIVSSKTVLPEGRERLFMALDGQDAGLSEWAPSIQLQPYLDALEAQYRRVENAIGVSHGVISKMDDAGYENVDNVRKSMRKTQAFINSVRGKAETMLGQLVYTWDVILNYYGIGAPGTYDVQCKWSDDYINTFTDQLNAIVAGNSIGAADGIDFRMHVFGESPEVAAQRVAEIRESKAVDFSGLLEEQ